MLRNFVVHSLRPRRRFIHRKAPLPGDEVLVPDTPEFSHVDVSNLGVEDVTEFDHKLITHLERLSLVRFSDEEAVANLRKSVQIANRLQAVNVDGVEPMYTVWEDQECPLRDDVPEEPLSTERVLSNAAKVYEDYFVTPPGNVPLEASEKLDLKLINEWDSLGNPSAPKPKKFKR